MDCKNHAGRKAVSTCRFCSDSFCRECLHVGGNYYYCPMTECEAARSEVQASFDAEARQKLNDRREQVAPELKRNALTTFVNPKVAIGRKRFQVSLLTILILLGANSFVLAANSDQDIRSVFILIHWMLLIMMGVQIAKRQRARNSSPWWGLLVIFNKFWLGILLVYITFKKDGVDSEV